MTNAPTFTAEFLSGVDDVELRFMSNIGRKNVAESRHAIEFRRSAGIDFSSLEADHDRTVANLELVTAEVVRRSNLA